MVGKSAALAVRGRYAAAATCPRGYPNRRLRGVNIQATRPPTAKQACHTVFPETFGSMRSAPFGAASTDSCRRFGAKCGLIRACLRAALVHAPCLHASCIVDDGVQMASTGYVLGAINTVACPDGSSLVLSVLGCQAAAAALGTTYAQQTLSNTYPNGCYQRSTNGLLYFNAPLNGGSPSPSAMPVCAASGAPLRWCMHWPAAIAARIPRGIPTECDRFQPASYLFCSIPAAPLQPGQSTCACPVSVAVDLVGPQPALRPRRLLVLLLVLPRQAQPPLLPVCHTAADRTAVSCTSGPAPTLRGPLLKPFLRRTFPHTHHALNPATICTGAQYPCNRSVRTVLGSV